ncbi:MAG: DNA methyltransferase [Microscillaceae bacterium]|nr:DNA methyltransferase [Microscillaceae bacterium]MDW8461642.1 site-specific DNA-methyltransferase [Cytophagales bacterium]
MQNLNAYLNSVLQGDCIEIMQTLPDQSVDLIFADPPYNLQLKNQLYRPDQSKVEGVFDEWDRFESFEQYDQFTKAWLSECKRLLKPNGSIWVIGSYHNIFRVGAIMQNLGFWFLNDIVWIKSNPMPNFNGTRFANAHETLIWATTHPKAKYTFHYHSLKTMNEDLQMRSDWYLPLCTGKERIKISNQKAHSAQKPEALLYRVIIATSNVGDTILDLFSGSGTTAAVAKKLGRNFVCIEKEPTYVQIIQERLKQIQPLPQELLAYKVEIPSPRVLFGQLVSQGIVQVGEMLFDYTRTHQAQVLADGSLVCNQKVGSIHKISAMLLGKPSNNGWKFWHVMRDNQLVLIDDLRKKYIEQLTFDG